MAMAGLGLLWLEDLAIPGEIEWGGGPSFLHIMDLFDVLWCGSSVRG